MEANIGTQFHPAVAKAFIALQRGQDPYSALTAEEQEELRSAAAPHHVPHLPGAGDLRERPELLALGGLVAALAGVGLDQPMLAVGGVVLAATGIVVRTWARYRSARVRRGLAAVLSAGERTQVFSRLAETLHRRAAPSGSGSSTGRRTASAARSSWREARLRPSGR